MEYIDLPSLTDRLVDIRAEFLAKRPFHYVVFEGFFYSSKADEIYDSYPTIKDGVWDSTTYIDQQNKFQKTKFESGSVAERVIQELNSTEFVAWLEKVTDIPDILADNSLLGGGLHQSINGAFLNVHIDYNVHEVTKLHRRLNVLVYMNREWKDEYEGQLELWDFTGRERKLLEKISPTFNRCVLFETNEISFHGHPKPLRTPPGVSRKSIATYYYTRNRPADEVVPEHNTIYVNTEGKRGQLKRFNSGLRAFVERISGRK
jgi:Rps23 Pro-64 3,4-dihydroxylase Tpa1-like proline 4-hydroxylase